MLTCLEWVFTLLQWGFYLVVIAGLILMMAGACGALGGVSYNDASLVGKAGMGCGIGFFAGLVLIIVLFRGR